MNHTFVLFIPSISFQKGNKDFGTDLTAEAAKEDNNISLPQKHELYPSIKHWVLIAFALDRLFLLIYYIFVLIIIIFVLSKDVL